MLKIEVFEIKGNCPVHKVGDKIVVDGPKILLAETDALCIHALAPLLHYMVALDHGVKAVDLGLTTNEDAEHAYIQCVDPYEPYTHGGTVIFKCRKISTE
ncbi:MAG: TIGR04076 family protein [Candidatus Bathyarchaeota archaeon]|nr:TIGR04076 family protein [Candidatus Bathyarchaeota archaeon]